MTANKIFCFSSKPSPHIGLQDFGLAEILHYLSNNIQVKGSNYSCSGEEIVNIDSAVKCLALERAFFGIWLDEKDCMEICFKSWSKKMTKKEIMVLLR